MTAALPWITLAVCVAVTLARIPSALRGQNRSVFYIFLLISLSIFISIEAPYLVIDGWLGGINVCNLVLRFLLYATFFLMGVKVATAFGSDSAVRAIRGPWGQAVAALVAILTIVFFVITETEGSSAGMSGLTWGPSLEAYAFLGRFYPGFVAACLVPAIWRTVTSSAPVPLRTASALLLLGLSLLLLSQLFPLVPHSAAWLMVLINYSAALLTCIGLTGIWFSKAYAKRKQRRMA